MRVWEVAKRVENVPCCSENKSIVPLLSREDLFVEVPYIDFIFGDEQRIDKVCGIVIQIPHLIYQFSRLHTQSKFGNQRKQFPKPTWWKILCQASRPYTGNEDRQEN